MKNIVKIMAFPLLIFLLLIFYQYKSSISYSKNPNSTKRIILNIKKGSTGNEISRTLKEKHLINNEIFFKYYLKQKNIENKLQAGKFVMQENFNMKEIVNSLINGKSEEISITLLEGWTIEEIGEYLEKKGLTTKQKFLDCTKNCELKNEILKINNKKDSLEGYLYPDTYFVNINNFDNEKFIQRLINTLASKISKKDLEAIKNSGKSIKDIIIMASIIEKESSNDEEEKAMISDILWSRIEKGVAMGADATLLYVLKDKKLDYNALQTDSKYNTRLYKGLPPTAISNPSISSIKAAIYPKANEYFYYLHGKDGKIHYGKNLNEHEANDTKYLN